MPQPCTQVALSVDVGSDPISGQVKVASGPVASFSGWIELAAVIESARAAQAPREAFDETPGGSPGANAFRL